MSEFQPLIDELYREEVERARTRTPEQRMDDGLELVRRLFGEDDPEMRRRMQLMKDIRERDCYGPPQPRL